MSRLTDPLRPARRAHPQPGKGLEEEFAALMKRRSFGLVFEQHQPEAGELLGRKVRRGDKVRALPPRGEVARGDQRLWKVEKVETVDGHRVAHLSEIGATGPDTQAVLVDDLAVVAEFNHRVYHGLVETGRVGRDGPEKPFHTALLAGLRSVTTPRKHVKPIKRLSGLVVALSKDGLVGEAIAKATQQLCKVLEGRAIQYAEKVERARTRTCSP